MDGTGVKTFAIQNRLNAAILAGFTGRIFDDRGNRMTPTHTNKQGARYRYYVSHAILQKRDGEAGSVLRISAPDIETTVAKAVRNHLDKRETNDRQDPTTDRELIEQYIERIIVQPQTVEIHLVSEAGHGPDEHDQDTTAQRSSESGSAAVIAAPWIAPATVAAKGVLHSPSPGAGPIMSADDRDILLTAIAKARAWIEDLVEGRVASFAEIAKQEGKVERHIHLLVQLAFVSPKIVKDIIESVASPITVTALAKHAGDCWINGH